MEFDTTIDLVTGLKHLNVEEEVEEDRSNSLRQLESQCHNLREQLRMITLEKNRIRKEAEKVKESIQDNSEQNNDHHQDEKNKINESISEYKEKIDKQNKLLAQYFRLYKQAMKDKQEEYRNKWHEVQYNTPRSERAHVIKAKSDHEVEFRVLKAVELAREANFLCENDAQLPEMDFNVIMMVDFRLDIFPGEKQLFFQVTKNKSEETRVLWNWNQMKEFVDNIKRKTKEDCDKDISEIHAADAYQQNAEETKGLQESFNSSQPCNKQNEQMEQKYSAMISLRDQIREISKKHHQEIEWFFNSFNDKIQNIQSNLDNVDNDSDDFSNYNRNHSEENLLDSSMENLRSASTFMHRSAKMCLYYTKRNLEPALGSLTEPLLRAQNNVESWFSYLKEQSKAILDKVHHLCDSLRSNSQVNENDLTKHFEQIESILHYLTIQKSETINSMFVPYEILGEFCTLSLSNQLFEKCNQFGMEEWETKVEQNHLISSLMETRMAQMESILEKKERQIVEMKLEMKNPRQQDIDRLSPQPFLATQNWFMDQRHRPRSSSSSGSPRKIPRNDHTRISSASEVHTPTSRRDVHRESTGRLHHSDSEKDLQANHINRRRSESNSSSQNRKRRRSRIKSSSDNLKKNKNKKKKKKKKRSSSKLIEDEIEPHSLKIKESFQDKRPPNIAIERTDSSLLKHDDQNESLTYSSHEYHHNNKPNNNSNDQNYFIDNNNNMNNMNNNNMNNRNNINHNNNNNINHNSDSKTDTHQHQDQEHNDHNLQIHDKQQNRLSVHTPNITLSSDDEPEETDFWLAGIEGTDKMLETIAQRLDKVDEKDVTASHRHHYRHLQTVTSGHRHSVSSLSSSSLPSPEKQRHHNDTFEGSPSESKPAWGRRDDDDDDDNISSPPSTRQIDPVTARMRLEEGEQSQACILQ